MSNPAGAATVRTDRNDERSRSDETRPADRPDFVLPLGRDSSDDPASVPGVVDHAGRREYSLADASGILILLEAPLAEFLTALHLPGVIVTMLSEGMYRVLAWVVSVMLPPMAIFFPLFTYLEDLGYLPRVAFNLDKTFAKAHACGKQALTTCMGLAATRPA